MAGLRHRSSRKFRVWHDFPDIQVLLVHKARPFERPRCKHDSEMSRKLHGQIQAPQGNTVSFKNRFGLEMAACKRKAK
jgi:hypothetical protein